MQEAALCKWKTWERVDRMRDKPDVSLTLRDLAAMNDQQKVAVAMQQIRQAGKEALPVLMGALHGDDPMLRDLACAVLGELGADAAEAVPGLIGMLGTDSEETRMAAALSLMRIGPSSIPQLLAVAEQGEGLTRFWACWALSWLDPSLLTSDMIECLRSEQEQPSTSITPYAAMEAISKVIARELKDGE